MLVFFIRLIVRLVFRVEYSGPVPAAAPERLLVISNHQSFLDPLLILSALPVKLTWVVHSQIAALPYFRPFLKMVDCLVVDAAHPMTMKTLVHSIEQGRPVGLFPEGRITVTGSQMKIYEGAAFLAARTGAAILPVHIDGAVHSYFGRMKPPFIRRWRPRVRVRFFPLEKMPELSGVTARERRRQAAEWLRRRMEEQKLLAQPRRTLFEALLDAMELNGRGAPILEDIRFTEESYGRLLRGALALARLVSRLSAERETVGVVMPNASPTVMLLFGMFAARRVPAMLNYTSGAEGLQSACETAGIRTVLTSRTFLERARLVEKLAALRGVNIVYLEDLRARFGMGDKLWLMLWAMRFPRAVMRPARPDDPAVVLFTSGSEGKPKGVVLSHASILANVDQMRAVFEFSNRDRFLAALPVFHSFGLTVGVLLPLVSGARLFLYPSPLHYRMVPEMAYDRDCTVLFGTGSFLARYAARAHPYDFRNVRYVVSGAEKLNAQVRQLWMEKFGIRIYEGYGATECSPVIAANTPMACRPGTVGQLLPAMEHRLRPVAGIGGGALLHVRGPNLMLGYYRPERPGVLEPPSSEFGAGWYDTGDVVEMDADGFLTIAGRVRRFAKVAGEMVSLEVVEQIAAHASPGRQHAAVEVPDARRGELIVLLTEDSALRREQLAAAARAHGLPELAVARLVMPVAKLPRMGSGKVDYVALKELAASLRAVSHGGG